MGYPNFGKVKTIVLPLVDTGTDGLTIAQYREKTGIDLRDIVKIDTGNKRVVIKTAALYLFANTPKFSESLGYEHVPAIAAPANFTSQAQSDTTPAQLIFEISTFPTIEGAYGAHFDLVIPKDKSLEYENLRVICSEL